MMKPPSHCTRAGTRDPRRAPADIGVLLLEEGAL